MTPTERQALVDESGRIIAQGSKSFRFASQIFNEQTRARSWLLYAWCRACDDVTDGQTLGHDAITPDDPGDARPRVGAGANEVEVRNLAVAVVGAEPGRLGQHGIEAER